MATEVIMPALELAQETGRILRWLKAEGDDVAKGEPLLEIETDKVTVDVEAPADGVLAGICAAEGQDVPVGETVAFVLAAGEEVPQRTAAAEAVSVSAAASATPLAPARRERPLASPKARRMARDSGVDLREIVGSGPHGAVLAVDLEASLDTGRQRIEARGRLASDGRADNADLADDATLLPSPRGRRGPPYELAETWRHDRATRRRRTPTCS